MAVRSIAHHHETPGYGEGTIILLLVLSAVLTVLALRMLTFTPAYYASEELHRRVSALQQLAQNEQAFYTMQFIPGTRVIHVSRWVALPDGGATRAEAVAVLSQPLPEGVVVDRTTLSAHTLVISDSGFPLSQGIITLRASDRSRRTVQIAETRR